MTVYHVFALWVLVVVLLMALDTVRKAVRRD